MIHSPFESRADYIKRLAVRIARCENLIATPVSELQEAAEFALRIGVKLPEPE